MVFDTSEPSSVECSHWPPSAHFGVHTPLSHNLPVLGGVSPVDLTVALFPNIGSEDNDNWDNQWDSGVQSPKSPQSPSSPSRKRKAQRATPKGKGKGKGKGKSKSKGKGKAGKQPNSHPNSHQSSGVRPEDIEIGCSAHKLKTTFTDTHVQFGHKSISKAALAKICNCGPSDRCWAVALSAMRWPICLQLCPCPKKAGHESHNSSQHRFTEIERAQCGKLAAP